MTIADYIKLQDDAEIKEILEKVYNTIKEAIPDAEECISWNMPTFRKGRNLIHFAPAKKHLGIYPGPEPIEEFADRLSGYNTSKGAIQFPYNKEIPYELIAEIAKCSYKHYSKD
ncbi:iron chaperone [Butyrivibrio sp.]|uniref:iron chaperone n=1 Tax=Butyrivibrio sp. TaxID=28121 RepID=UPI0025C0921A|nr:DUF1801 domain-containing protein [Butyrivibrio sp.]MBQ9304993.1 DUF1801 domain-containing protein [Butyrivibrio sp.]